jgi:AGZA family xanthine/uracil permease-like MFS transporter
MWSSVAERLDVYFCLTERGTTISTEIRAGTASFLTLSYLLLVNPQIMAQAGVSHDDAVFATALSAAISCFIVGVLGNLPFGCAPGLGLSAYLTFGLVQADLCTLQEALTACWWSGIFVLVISVTGLAAFIMRSVPHSIKLAIVVGMGLLIAMIGMVSINLIVANPKTLVELGDVWGDADLQLSLAGILLVASLLYHDIKGAILIGIALLTFIDWALNNSWPETIFQVPAYHSNDYWDPLIVFDMSKASVFFPAISAFVLICIFDISGVGKSIYWWPTFDILFKYMILTFLLLIGVAFGLATLGGIMQDNGEIPGSLWAFIASAVGTLVAAWTGSTPIIVCVECAAGVREGGRTGLTAVVIGLYFTLSLFLAPLFSAVPEIATAPVLIMVGVMMMGESAKIPWENMNDALPAFLTIILMPLTYSITNGIIFGLLTSAGFYFTTGQFLTDAKDLHRKMSDAGDDDETEMLVEEEKKDTDGDGVKDYGSV